MNYHRTLSLSLIFTSLFSPLAMAGDPTAAVSGITGTVLGVGGSAGGQGIAAGGAGVSFPITHSIGAQLDAGLSKADATGGGELGGHLFTRDPDSYLLGATFEYTRFGSVNSYRYGAEGELYLNDFTIAPAAGIQRGGANRGATTAGFASLQADYYAFDRLKTSISFGGYAGYRSIIAEAEWQVSPDQPFALFVDAGSIVSVNDHGIFLAGVKYTFGAPNTTIKDRDRHGDPELLLQSGMSSANLIGNTLALTPPAMAPATPSAPLGGGDS